MNIHKTYFFQCVGYQPLLVSYGIMSLSRRHISNLQYHHLDITMVAKLNDQPLQKNANRDYGKIISWRCSVCSFCTWIQAMVTRLRSYIYIHIHIWYIYIYTYIYLFIYLYIWYVYMICIYTYIYMICMYIYIHMCVFVCTYRIHMYRPYIYTHTCNI